MSKTNKLRSVTVATAAGAGIMLAAQRIASAPPDPALQERARVAQYSGPWRHGFADVNGVRLHYAEIGSGPLVILLHGFPECWYAWHYVMQRLGTQFRVVAPDMRGYNMSSKPEGVDSYKLTTLGNDVAGLIQALGETRAHVVGHDWGGAVAWHVGEAHGDRVEKLVILNAPHPGAYARELAHLNQLLKSYYIFLFQLPILPEAVMRLTLRSTMPNSAFTPGTFSPDALDVYANNLQQPGSATAMLNYYRAAARTILSQWAQPYTNRITRPTMVLWGMRDFALSSALLNGLEEWVPDLRIERMEDSGHWLPEEKPGWVAEKLADFLA